MEQANLWEQYDNVVPLPTAIPPASSPQRNLVWDTLEEILGFTPRTKTEKAAFAKVARSLADAEATPDEMSDAAAEYSKCWPYCELTLWSFEKWFGHFLSKAERRVNRRAACSECGVGGGMHAADCPQATS